MKSRRATADMKLARRSTATGSRDRKTADLRYKNRVPDGYLLVGQAATLLEMSTGMVWKLWSRGEITMQQFGNVRGYPLASLEAWKSTHPHAMRHYKQQEKG